MIKTKACRVLVVDDSALYRKIVRSSLEGIPGVEVVGAAYDGMDAMAQCRQLNPDLLTLDITMPRMDGLETLKEIRKINPNIGVIMVSSLTSQGADITTQALTSGAFDFVLKPNGNHLEENVRKLRSDLAERITAYLPLMRQRQSSMGNRETLPTSPSQAGFSGRSSSVSTKGTQSPSSLLPASNGGVRISTNENGQRYPNAAPADAIVNSLSRLSQDSDGVTRQFNQPASGLTSHPSMGSSNFKCSCVAIGVSTGGPQALGRVIPMLSASLCVPVFIVQHMPPLFTKSLADCLSATSSVKVYEASHGQPVLPGEVYIAPGGKHMRIAKTLLKATIEITEDPPISSCRPSVDYLFDSINSGYGSKALAIIMTGMGGDGLEGCRKIHKSGGRIVAQEASTCTVYGMPRQIVENNLAHDILPLESIANLINRLTSKAVLV